jgi:hypothetical protein
MTLLGSCGFFDDPPVEEADFYNYESQSCDINPDEFSQIFEQEINNQIKCLKENFLLFSRIVRTNSNDWIEEDELRRFILKHFQDNADAIVKGIQVLFELNMLILRDRPGQISRDNIEPIFQLVLTLNQASVDIFQSLTKISQSPTRIEYWLARRKISDAIVKLRDSTQQIMKDSGNIPQNLNLRDFLIQLPNRFQLDDFELDKEIIDSLIFLKQFIIGGDREQINSNEFYVLLDKLPRIAMTAIDLLYLTPNYFVNGKIGLYGYYAEKVDSVKSIIAKLPHSTELFTSTDLIKMLTRFEGDDFQLVKFQALIDSFKLNMLGGSKESYQYTQLMGMIDYLRIFLRSIQYKEQINKIRDDIGLQVKASEKNIDRQYFMKSTSEYLNHLQSIFTQNQHIPKVLKYGDFTKLLPIELDDFFLQASDFEVIYGIKQAFVGGEREVITIDELIILTKKLRETPEELYNLLYALEADLPQEKFVVFINDFLRKVSKLVLPQVNEEKKFLFYIKDLKLVLRRFLNSNQYEMLKIIDSLEKYFLTETPGQLDLNEFKDLINTGRIATSLVDFFHQRNQIIDSDTGSKRDRQKKHQELVSKFKITLVELLKASGFPTTPINWKPLLLEIYPIISNDDEFNPDIVNALAPFKMTLFGGDKEQITQTDLLKLLELIELLADEWFHLDTNTNGITDKNIISTIQKISDKLPSRSDETILFTTDHIVKLAGIFLNSLPVDTFKSTVAIAKTKILGGDGDHWTQKDLKTILSMGLEYFEQNSYNKITYEKNAEVMKSPELIPTLIFKEYKEYEHLTQSNLRKYHAAFVDVIKKHRYFREKESGLQYLSTNIQRNESGLSELVTLKWIISLFLKGWGHQVPGSSEYTASLKEVEQLLIDFKPVLIEFKLWSANFETFARNTLLLGDLFQFNSNGSTELDLDESTEYATLVLSAISLSSKVLETMEKYCPNLAENNPEAEYLFSTPCYRIHYFRILMEELNMKEKLPFLQNYIKTSTKAEIQTYLTSVEGFSRENDQSEPMTVRDFTLLTGAFLNIETTFLRFDQNKDNLVETWELDLAFKIYEDAIISIANLEGDSAKFARAIFIYMIKNMETPSNTSVFIYHYGPDFIRQVEGKRLNIGTLLYYLVNE